MATGQSEQLKSQELDPQDARKTYRYLRIGMIGAVALLAVSILIEHGNVDCWQTSISAYYYTPVRAIFVGSLFAVGLSLIVYKGRAFLEDTFLNFAGMLVPVVAIAPTTNVGVCWSVPPNPRPIMRDGSLAPWVVTNIENNFDALLIAGAMGLILAAIIATLAARGSWILSRGPSRETVASLGVTALALLIGWWLSRNWSDFNTEAHGLAALGTFAFLIAAVGVNAREHRRHDNKLWFRVYAAVAAFMGLGGFIIWATQMFQDHNIFALEAYELFFFAIYWSFQTRENWDEEVQQLKVEADIRQRNEGATVPRA